MNNGGGVMSVRDAEWKCVTIPLVLFALLAMSLLWVWNTYERAWRAEGGVASALEELESVRGQYSTGSCGVDRIISLKVGKQGWFAVAGETYKAEELAELSWEELPDGTLKVWRGNGSSRKLLMERSPKKTPDKPER